MYAYAPQSAAAPQMRACACEHRPKLEKSKPKCFATQQSRCSWEININSLVQVGHEQAASFMRSSTFHGGCCSVRDRWPCLSCHGEKQRQCLEPRCESHVVDYSQCSSSPLAPGGLCVRYTARHSIRSLALQPNCQQEAGFTEVIPSNQSVR